MKKEKDMIGKKYSTKEKAKAFFKGQSFASIIWAMPWYLLKQMFTKKKGIGVVELLGVIVFLIGTIFFGWDIDISQPDEQYCVEMREQAQSHTCIGCHYE